MKQLKSRDLLLVGFTLFSMFFGAGNLIFPPNIAAQAGTMTWFAMLGMTLSAVGLPVLGIIAVARSGGLDVLGGRVHPLFAKIFTVIAYLAIGPCLAIPRTASTSFEMAVPPFVGGDAPIAVYQLIYSLVFFVLALIVALRPEKLTDRLGKIMCPILIALIVITFVGCVINPLEGYGAAGAGYETPVQAVSTGFLAGYNTMDTIAALVFGIIISLNIRARGVEEDRAVVRGAVRAGIIAGVLLFVIYSMLAHIGALSGGAFPNPENGAQALTNIVAALFGRLGNVLLAAIFVIACFNVCVGLICSCGEYFNSICPKLSYRAWAVLFAVVSMVLANAGLNQILAVSGPVLNMIYPVVIMLILLAYAQPWLEGRRMVYPMTILFTGVASILFEVQRLLKLEVLNGMPLAELNLGWILPAAVGVIVGLILSGKKAEA
ncbi:MULTISPECIES: branched-chain amino acid transport system II carrier protein [Eubacteriales]|uniref:branched-chain amino acid transport system II carrier protein n=1 Tax=Eubacteriales TaxID=186802 RepID=UPI000C78B5C2|nr:MULTISPECIES: branched-chain amino acid transport system II carrier protein [Eubacteriales]MBT9683372.1 branched-chain amino acid transport system II carrier protein [Pseudoflavonifractor sp. MCC625]